MHNCYQTNNCGSMPYMMPSGGCSNSVPSGRCSNSVPSDEYSNSVDCTCFLAISTVPWQHFTEAYEPAQAFQIGTIFPELDKPFLGRSVIRS